MKEWEPYIEHVSSETVQFNWKLQGELDLDLVLIGPKEYDLDRPYFEMARTLRDPRLISLLEVSEWEHAIKAIEKNGQYTDCFWRGSKDELIDFCNQSLLPLPTNYEDAWRISSQLPD